MLNLAMILEDSAKRYPAKVAFTYMDTSLTYVQVNAAASKIANELKALTSRQEIRYARAVLIFQPFRLLLIEV